MDKVSFFNVRGEFLRATKGNFALGCPYVGSGDPAAFAIFIPAGEEPELVYYVPHGTVKIAHRADDARWYPQ